MGHPAGVCGQHRRQYTTYTHREWCAIKGNSYRRKCRGNQCFHHFVSAVCLVVSGVHFSNTLSWKKHED